MESHPTGVIQLQPGENGNRGIIGIADTKDKIEYPKYKKASESKHKLLTM